MSNKINDFSISIATINGTGSQSANSILFKSIFRMGIGVCTKNLFPSNIQGLPTWYKIRISQKGYQCPRENDDIAILMNPATARDDLKKMGAGTSVFYNSDTMKYVPDEAVKGVALYPIPVETLARKLTNAKLRTLLKNLFYVAAVAQIYGIDETILRGVIEDTFKQKQKAVDANMEALQIGFDYSKENLKKTDEFGLKGGEKPKGKILLDGNAAAALGAVYGGCTIIAWYPITPSSSVAEAAITYMKKFRTNSEGKTNYAIVQAEDELSSAGIVIGAGWAGARSMTATSGPGISLMSEFIGLAYYAEVPSVFIDVQRVGPSTGLPTRTQQCDTLLCATASHGDTKHICLYPSTLNECFEMSQEAFELAELFQTPIFFVTDLDLGMNTWVGDELDYKPLKMDRGKVLDDEALKKVKEFGRYLDVDGDGIPYRTLPGTSDPKGAYFTRGSGHDEYAKYTESAQAYTRNMERLLKKFNTAKKFVPKPVITGDSSSKVGLIAYGTSHHAVMETLDRMNGQPIKYLKLNAYPFSPEVEDFLKSCDKVIVIEQNRDLQMRKLIETEIPGYQDKMDSINYYGGHSLSADFVERELKKKLG